MSNSLQSKTTKREPQVELTLLLDFAAELNKNAFVTFTLVGVSMAVKGEGTLTFCTTQY
jgi:hypothetical protein